MGFCDIENEILREGVHGMVRVCMLSYFRHVWFFATLWTVAMD